MKRGPGYREFVTLMAVMISITALSIDMMLPALPEIGRDLRVGHANDVQLVVTVLLFGMGIGQLVFGPLADSFGRKPVILTGFVIFIMGCWLSVFSSRFEVMVIGRMIQGIGTGGPRTAILALVRDQYGGRAMARIMSVVMAIFIVVPAIAPAVGQAVLLTMGWRAIFGVLMIQGFVALTWFAVRQPETLSRDDRIPFSGSRILDAVLGVCKNRRSMGYTLASGFIAGALMSYLSSAQQLFQEVYGLGREFPIYMAVLALFVGGASFVNSRIVMRFGMRALSHRAVLLFIVLTTMFLAATCQMGGRPPLWLMMAFFAPSFFCMGILFGNLSAIAMDPLKHMAGIGAAIVGSLSNFISSSSGALVGRCYDGSALPLACGLVILGILTAIAMRWSEKPPVVKR
ncbi:Bcr/CflA family drug resistance efflux transporter [Desulfosarcina alkanivorans]|uniref:Bcr/CflA family drug resistance efflux transporter n=1 Tax=Desulfosarcina alkanivorans TaxID=571177 RepID=A0A5K7YVB3_9BACT|nr:multidrug effflux MFS transporter [Desulfosarcina alkanivorans]BBO72260.1 Bcr/CflA family drug resistance efflux transporter [Desulfosarcina alkanivorans]